MPREHRKGWAYVRVSTLEQLRSTLGVNGYLADIFRYADANDIDLGPECEIEVEGVTFQARTRCVIEAASASKIPFLKRKGGKRLATSALPGEHILVSKVDRAFRSYEDAHHTTKRLLGAGYVVHYLDMGGLLNSGNGMSMDLTSGFGGLMLHLFGLMAEFETTRRSERLLSANMASRAAGRGSICHTPPWGFLFEGKGSSRKLKADPRQMAVLRQVAEWRKLKWGAEKIAMKLRSLGIPALNRADSMKKRWGNELTMKTVRNIVAAADRYAEIYGQTGLAPEDGERWLREFHERSANAEAERKAKRLERAAQRNHKRLVAAE